MDWRKLATPARQVRYIDAMPRYRLNVQGLDRCTPDYDGLEASDALTVQAVARLSILELADELHGLGDCRQWAFIITDEVGHSLRAVPFSGAQEPGSGRA